MVGQNIGKYRVLDRVGRGGMGTVYRALDETLHREVAIKVLNAELNDPTVARRFQAEAVTVARLNHPGIATVYELFQNDGQWLMVMEFLRGETLEHLAATQGPIPVERASDLCMQALAALAHAHSLGVVHRDLKPANLMVNDAGVVKVMDFGIARVAGTEHLTSAGFMMGTPAYMAPEQVRGEDIDARTDLFAIGVMLFFLTTGKFPFRGDTPIEMAQSRMHEDAVPISSVRPDLPEWFGQVVGKALARPPAERYQSAPVFREALRRGLANLPLETPPPVVRPAETAVSADLMVTAAPGSMAVPMAPASPPQPAAPSTPALDEMPTIASSSPIAAAPAPRSAEPAIVSAPLPPATAPAKPAARSTPASSSSRVGLLAAAGVIVVLALGGGWWWMRHGSAASPAASSASNTPAPSTAAPPAEAASPTADAAAPSTDLPVVEIPPPPAGTPPDVPPAAPATSSASAPASSPPASASAAPPARGGAATPAPARGGAGIAAAAAADTHLAFGDVRVLRFNGKKAEERPGVLNFVGGQISVLAPRGGAVLASMPYRELTYAVYVHAKDPKWSVVLSAPPPDPDLPGGLFRSARHWLTLQSRSAFMIVRLNDDDWRRVVETVSARTGVQVERPASDR